MSRTSEALAATGKFSLFLGICGTVLACIVADAFWSYLGMAVGAI